MKRKLLPSLAVGFWVVSAVAMADTIDLAKEIRGKTININNANVELIVANTSFDRAVASEIVNYRKKYGHFKTISELLKVPNVQFRDIRENNNISLK